MHRFLHPQTAHAHVAHPAHGIVLVQLSGSARDFWRSKSAIRFFSTTRKKTKSKSGALVDNEPDEIHAAKGTYFCLYIVSPIIFLMLSSPLSYMSFIRSMMPADGSDFSSFVFFFLAVSCVQLS